MRTVHKQVLAITNFQRVDLPHHAVILCAKDQMEAVCIWYICDPELPSSTRIIRMFGTGHPVHEDTDKYLGTAFLNGGQLVFHVFEGF